MRSWALAACSADVTHADTEFWRLAHELDLTARFDRYLDPGCPQAAAMPHERKAASVLNWLQHLQVEEWLIARSIGSGMLRSDRSYLRALFSRRLRLKQGFRRTLADYRALRSRLISSWNEAQ
jgi:hypothetical protein